MAEVSDQRSHLLSLPPEIREQIYRLILDPAANKFAHPNEYYHYNYEAALPLFRINRQIYYEARKIFRDLNRFVRVETPWPQAADHVALEGHVPIVISGPKAQQFQGHVMNVAISAPEYPEMGDYKERFHILAEDVEKFAKVWSYGGLSHPGMNPHLRLDLQLRDPYTPEYEEKRMSKQLQQQLLFPFGGVKDLAEFNITGDSKPLASIVTEVRELQKQPYPSPEHCLRETIRHKDEGNAALKAGNYCEAISLYHQAWEAMHIIIKGRKRHIHGDAFFARELREEPFIGKSAQRERLILRVTLVANTCLVYLKLEDYEECLFWGMRTINMLRDAMGVEEDTVLSAEDEAVLQFPAAAQMGKIYYRCALAHKYMDDKSEARRLLRVAREYLPHDKAVAEEIAACALRIG